MRPFAALLLLALPMQALAADLVGTVSVTDGDTLDLHGEHLRLHAIDAPESSQVCLDGSGQKYLCGGRAADALDKLVAGRTVTCTVLGKANWGRLTARCAVGGVDLGAAMVTAGWALAYREYGLDYVAAEDAARAARRGLWAGTFEEPWAFRAARRATAATPATPAPVRDPGCCRTCSAGKACGDGCIGADATCHQPKGCACDG